MINISTNTGGIDKENKLNLLHVFRGIAALLVVYLHITTNFNSNLPSTPFLQKIFSFGGSGVDFFFVLSGFIIAYSSQKLAAQKKYTAFLKKRFFRIFPVYWIIIIFFILAQLSFPRYYNAGYTFSLTNLVATFLLLPGHLMVNGVTWTLSFELYFYLLFLVYFLPVKRSIIHIFMVLYALAIIANNGLYFSNSIIFSPLGTEFLLGLLAYELIRGKLITTGGLAFVICGIVLFILGAILANHNTEFFYSAFDRVVLFGIPSFLLVTGSVLLEGQKNINPPQIFLSLGDASYSLYLLHLPLVAAAIKLYAKLKINHLLLNNLFGMVLSLAVVYVAITFYKYVEKPLLLFFKKI